MLSRYPMIDVDRSDIEEMIVVETESLCILDFHHISQYQKIDNNIKQNLSTGTYNMKAYDKETLATLNGKIVIPTLVLNDIIIWYHENLQHPVVSRTYKTINSHFYYLSLEKYIGTCIKKCFIYTETKKLL